MNVASIPCVDNITDCIPWTDYKLLIAIIYIIPPAINWQFIPVLGYGTCHSNYVQLFLLWKDVKVDIFSGYGQKNNSIGGRFRVKRGIENIKDVGRVVEYEGQKQLSVYDGEECNKFRGTDSTIFPPFLTTSDKVEAFAPDLCR